MNNKDLAMPDGPGPREPSPTVSAVPASVPIADDDYDDPDDNLCDCCGEPWEFCKDFFVNWICGLGPDGQCSLAGTEDCDFECPRRF